MSRRQRVRGRPIADVLAAWPLEVIKARFWAKVSTDGPIPERHPELGPCHVWTGDKTSHGYGMFQRIGAHRVAMWLDTGDEPGKREVLHHCDNPPCVRRSHLRYGTHRDNMADMAERKRAARPIKVTDAEVAELRERYAAGEKMAGLIVEYGISQQQGARIVSGRTRNLAPVETDWRASGRTAQRNKLNAAQREEIRRRRRAGESATALAIEFMISPPYVSEIANGRRTRNRTARPERQARKPLPPGIVREIRAMHAAGAAQAELAAQFDINRSTVSRIVARLIYREVA